VLKEPPVRQERTALSVIRASKELLELPEPMALMVLLVRLVRQAIKVPKVPKARQEPRFVGSMLRAVS
jgi:hypothetical protein